jgi:hypothetical protein
MKFRFSILVVVALLAVTWVPVCDSEEWWWDDWEYADFEEASSHAWWNGTDYHIIKNMTFFYIGWNETSDFNMTINYRVYRYYGRNHTFPGRFEGTITNDTHYFWGLNGTGEIPFQYQAVIPNATNRYYGVSINIATGPYDQHSFGRRDWIDVPLRSDIRLHGMSVSPEVPVNGEKVAVTAIVNNLGNGKEDIRLELYMDGEPVTLIFGTIGQYDVESYTLFWTAKTGYRDIEVKVRNANNATLASEKSEKVLVRYLSPAAWSNIYIGLGTVLFLTYVRFHFRRAAKRL